MIFLTHDEAPQVFGSFVQKRTKKEEQHELDKLLVISSFPTGSSIEFLIITLFESAKTK